MRCDTRHRTFVIHKFCAALEFFVELPHCYILCVDKRYAAVYIDCCSQTLQTFGEWLNNIAFQAPDAPLVLVGTHKDELDSPHTQLPEAQRLLHKYMKDTLVTGKDGILKNLRCPPEGDQKQWFFAVDSKSREEISIATGQKSSDEGTIASDEGIIGLRNAIHEAVLTDSREVEGLCL